MRRLGPMLASAVLLVAVFAIAACGGDDDSESSGGLTTINYAQPTPPCLCFYPAIVGQELGYFEEEGIEINIIPSSEEIPLPAFVENGDADIATSDAAATLFAQQRGSEFKVIYDEDTKAAEGIVVAEDSDVESMADLAGLTVGLTSDENRVVLEGALNVSDMSPDDVDTAVVGSSGPTVSNSLANGDIDAYSGSYTDFAALTAAGQELREITPDELAKTPAASWIVTPSFLESNRDDIAAFMKAYAKATYVAFVNEPVVEAMVREAVPEEWQRPEVGKALLGEAIELHAPENEDLIGEVRPDPWADAMQLLLDGEELQGPVDLDELLTNEFIEAANDWDRSEVEQEAQEWADQNL